MPRRQEIDRSYHNRNDVPNICMDRIDALVSSHRKIARLVGVVRAVNLSVVAVTTEPRSCSILATASFTAIAIMNSSLCVICDDLYPRQYSHVLVFVCGFLSLVTYTFYLAVIATPVLYSACLGLILKHGRESVEGKRIKLMVTIVFYVAATLVRATVLSTGTESFLFHRVSQKSTALRYDITPAVINPIFAYALSGAIQEAVHNLISTSCRNRSVPVDAESAN